MGRPPPVMLGPCASLLSPHSTSHLLQGPCKLLPPYPQYFSPLLSKQGQLLEKPSRTVAGQEPGRGGRREGPPSSRASGMFKRPHLLTDALGVAAGGGLCPRRKAELGRERGGPLVLTGTVRGTAHLLPPALLLLLDRKRPRGCCRARRRALVGGALVPGLSAPSSPPPPAVESLPVLACLQSSAALHKALSGHCRELRQVDARRWASFFAAGVEPDDFQEALQDLRTLAGCYQDCASTEESEDDAD